MGFFSALKRGIGNVANVVKKIAQFSAPVIRGIGQYALPAGHLAGGIASAMGDPRLSKITSGVQLASDIAHRFAPKVADKIDTVGEYSQVISDKLRRGRPRPDE